MKVGGKNVKKSNPDFQTAEFRFGYLYRDIEVQLNNFANEVGGTITGVDAARWVGTLLLAKAGRGVLDGAKHMSALWRHSSERNEVGTATAKVHVRSRHRKTSVKHWTQRPENKAKLRKTLAAANKARGLKVKGPASYWAKMTRKEQERARSRAKKLAV